MIKREGQNIWLIKVSVRVPGRTNPIKKQELFYGTKTEAECRQAEIIRQLKDCGSLTYLPKNARTFGEAVDLYLAKIRAQGKLSTGYNCKVVRLRREFGHLPVNKMPEYFEAWMKHLTRTPMRSGKMPSPATINRPVEIVRAVYNHLVAMEEMERNPITALRFPKRKEKPRDRYLTAEERARLVQAVYRRRPQMLPLIQYMLLVPCRVSELTTAKREQYNPFTNTVYIPDSKADIPINKPVPEGMTEYFRSIPPDCPWLFYWTDAQGKYRRFAAIRNSWLDCLRIAGLSNFRIHDLRHIASTDLYEMGNPERNIMDIAGWKTPMLSKYRHKDSLRSAQRMVFNSETGVARQAVEGGQVGAG